MSGETHRLFDQDSPDELPLSEVRTRKAKSNGTGITYWHWQIDSMAGEWSAVGYPDRAIARKRGAEELRRLRQLAAMQRGE